MARKYYPFNEAVDRAAKQNFARDARHGLETGDWETTDEDTRNFFLEEAAKLMKYSGQNYDPERPDTDLICVENFVKPV